MELKYGSKFKRDMKVVLKRGCDSALLTEALKILMAGDPLDSRFRDHALSGDYENCFTHLHIEWRA